MILRILSWTPSRRSRVPESRQVSHWFAVVPGKADYLSATDAIAMGRNLPIGPVVFTTLRRSGMEVGPALSGEENRQIAGRAGTKTSEARSPVNSWRTFSARLNGRLSSDGGTPGFLAVRKGANRKLQGKESSGPRRRRIFVKRSGAV